MPHAATKRARVLPTKTWHSQINIFFLKKERCCLELPCLSKTQIMPWWFPAYLFNRYANGINNARVISVLWWKTSVTDALTNPGGSSVITRVLHMWKEEAEVSEWCEKDSTGHCWLWRWKGPQAKEYRWPLQVRKDKKTNCPLEPPERNAALILAQWESFQTSDLQNYTINMCGFKPRNLW